MTQDTPNTNALDPELLALLRCPLTRSKLRQEGDHLVADVGGLRYPVRDGIPVMLIEEASTVDEAEITRLESLIRAGSIGPTFEV